MCLVGGEETHQNTSIIRKVALGGDTSNQSILRRSRPPQGNSERRSKSFSVHLRRKCLIELLESQDARYEHAAVCHGHSNRVTFLHYSCDQGSNQSGSVVMMA